MAKVMNESMLGQGIPDVQENLNGGWEESYKNASLYKVIFALFCSSLIFMLSHTVMPSIDTLEGVSVVLPIYSFSS